MLFAYELLVGGRFDQFLSLGWKGSEYAIARERGSCHEFGDIDVNGLRNRFCIRMHDDHFASGYVRAGVRAIDRKI